MFSSDRQIYEKLTENLEQGPRNKMPATYALEEIVYGLLDINNEIYYHNNKENELEIKINERTYNLTQILEQHPDFEQLSLDDQVLDRYVDFMKQRGMPEFFKSDLNVSPFHPAEVIAIKQYTSTTGLNHFLRAYGFYTYPLSNDAIKIIILSICIASHGLSRPREKNRNILSEITKGFTFKKLKRKEQYMLKLATEREFSINTGQPIFAAGFTSTSSSKIFTWPGDVKIYISQLKNNPMAKSIKKLSLFPSQSEYVFVPNTQFIFYEADKDPSNHTYTYHAIPVRPITRPINATPARQDTIQPAQKTQSENLVTKTHTNFFQLEPMTQNQMENKRIERLEKCFQQEFNSHHSASNLKHQNTINEINHFMKAIKASKSETNGSNRLLGCLIMARNNADLNSNHNSYKHSKFHRSTFATKLAHVINNYLVDAAIAGDKQTLSEQQLIDAYCNPSGVKKSLHLT